MTTTPHHGKRFDRLPETDTDREIPDRPTRQEVLTFFEDRYAISQDIFAPYSFWEKGKGKIWMYRGTMKSPVEIEALGIHLLRTRQNHWKPTTNGIQVIGHHATRNVIELAPSEARTYWAGQDQPVSWDGDQGYLIVSRQLAGRVVPLGIGLYIDGELRSVVPKSQQRELGQLTDR